MLESLALCALAAVGAFLDIRARTIPNLLVLVIFVAGLVMLGVKLPEISLLSHLAHFGIALVATMGLYALGAWGGGDAKFYAALALWFDLGQALLFLVATAVAGLLLLSVMLCFRAVKKRPDWSRELPYGVAIATGAIATQIGPSIL